MHLADAPVNAAMKVLEVSAGGALSTRLMEMGLVAGTPVRVVGHAPFGGALHVDLCDTHLALRNAEAALVQVTAA